MQYTITVTVPNGRGCGEPPNRCPFLSHHSYRDNPECVLHGVDIKIVQTPGFRPPAYYEKCVACINAEKGALMSFEQQFARVQEVTGTRTQIELAEILGIRQSSISDANRRQSVPDSWLLLLLEKYSTNPAWVRTGAAPQYMIATDIKPE